MYILVYHQLYPKTPWIGFHHDDERIHYNLVRNSNWILPAAKFLCQKLKLKIAARIRKYEQRIGYMTSVKNLCPKNLCPLLFLQIKSQGIGEGSCGDTYLIIRVGVKGMNILTLADCFQQFMSKTMIKCQRESLQNVALLGWSRKHFLYKTDRVTEKNLWTAGNFVGRMTSRLNYWRNIHFDIFGDLWQLPCTILFSITSVEFACTCVNFTCLWLMAFHTLQCISLAVDTYICQQIWQWF